MITIDDDCKTAISQTHELQRGDWREHGSVRVVSRHGKAVFEVSEPHERSLHSGELLVPELHDPADSNRYLTAAELVDLANGPHVSSDEPGWDY